MIVIPVRDLPVDRSWWRPLGMRASGSHVVSFDGVAIDDDWVLGGLDDFIKEPWFTAGAIRFAAVHVGGMHALLDAVATHLRNVQRINDPYQRHRLGKMGIDVEGGYAWLDHVATLWEQANKSSNLGIMATANAGRLAIEAAALSVLESAERGVGAVGMIAPHPLERLIRDLRTYLRQPNPDASLSYVGAAIAEGRWSPGHTPPQRK
jgi:alkylation response protein AidB-like acyl-CoA dehydrogenase